MLVQLYASAIAGTLFGVMLGCALSQTRSYWRGVRHGRMQGRHERTVAAQYTNGGDEYGEGLYER